VPGAIYAMDGDFAPTQQIVEISSKNDACIILDDAQCTGVTGETMHG